MRCATSPSPSSSSGAARRCSKEETRTSRLKRSLEEIAKWLFADLDFPGGAFLMTGTGIVPPDDFTLRPGDAVRMSVGDLVLENEVE